MKNWLVAGAACAAFLAPSIVLAQPTDGKGKAAPPGAPAYQPSTQRPGEPPRKHPEDRIKAGVCKKKECFALVTIDDCRITVDPEWLVVAHGNKDVYLIWEIGSEGYTFAREDGIKFKPSAGAAAKRQFSLDRKRSNDRTFVFTDKNSAPGKFPYAVRALKGGKPCPDMDPTIVNDMP
jgi:hypothetical protein